MSSLSSLQQALETWNTSIDLNEGWNMFGYGCPSPTDLAEGLSNHTESINIVKDNNGKVYMPEFSFNGIGDLTPGFGYQIKLSEALEDFSLCDWYVNDIPEDNIGSLQDENASLQAFVDSVNAYGCTDSLSCNFNESNLYEDGTCEYPEQGYDCEGNLVGYFIGMEAFGGLIFYIDETGEHGLVAALEDIIFNNTAYYGDMEWGCWLGGTYTGSLTSDDRPIETPIAASKALAYESGGYSDWYLPSKDELVEMYNSIAAQDSSGYPTNYFINTGYWSSSQHPTYSGQNVWVTSFSNGFAYIEYGNDLNRVRAIRSF